MLYRNKTIKFAFVYFYLIGLFLPYTPVAAQFPLEISLFSRHNHSGSDHLVHISSEWLLQPKNRNGQGEIRNNDLVALSEYETSLTDEAIEESIYSIGDWLL
jgi:hypothetical protein